MNKIKGLFAVAMLLVMGANAQTTKWNNDPTHSSIKFTVSHLTVSEVEGRFKSFSGTIESPTKDFQNASVTFSVDVPSITTDDENRDKHLKSDDFFNAEKYPKMTFKSTSFKKIKGNIYYAGRRCLPSAM